jgi:hypothetical protein
MQEMGTLEEFNRTSSVAITVQRPTPKTGASSARCRTRYHMVLV